MTYRVMALALITAILPFSPPSSASERVTVFTTSNLPVEVSVPGSQPAITVYELDTAQRLHEELSRGLPPDPEQAKALAAQRLASRSQALEAAWRGLAQARAWRIAKVPAIVFGDGEAVVYGMQVLAPARAKYREWQRSGGRQ